MAEGSTRSTATTPVEDSVRVSVGSALPTEWATVRGGLARYRRSVFCGRHPSYADSSSGIWELAHFNPGHSRLF
jgi:hypothetical protein